MPKGSIRSSSLSLILILTLALAGCQVRRARAPESTRQLRVAEVKRVVDQLALGPAVWSPDGSRLAYHGKDGLYVAAVAGGPPRRIAPVDAPAGLSWSRPLDLLAVVDRGGLWTLAPDGTKRRRLNLPGFITIAVWAPGSDRMGIVLRRTIGGASHDELWLASPSGGFRRRIVQAPAGRRIRSLQWFPDSLFLLYGLSTDADAVVREAWRVRIAYPDRLEVPLAGPALMLRLSPTGRSIAYVMVGEDGAGVGRVVISRLDGGGRFFVTPQPGHYSGLDWSPQGDKLAFAEVIDAARSAEIWAADADATGEMHVHTYAMEFSSERALSLAWSPNGRRLLFGTNVPARAGPVWMASFERR